MTITKEENESNEIHNKLTSVKTVKMIEEAGKLQQLQQGIHDKLSKESKKLPRNLDSGRLQSNVIYCIIKK